jgi:hypothetical protein
VVWLGNDDLNAWRDKQRPRVQCLVPSGGRVILKQYPQIYVTEGDVVGVFWQEIDVEWTQVPTKDSRIGKLSRLFEQCCSQDNQDCRARVIGLPVSSGRMDKTVWRYGRRRLEPFDMIELIKRLCNLLNSTHHKNSCTQLKNSFFVSCSVCQSVSTNSVRHDHSLCSPSKTRNWLRIPSK